MEATNVYFSSGNFTVSPGIMVLGGTLAHAISFGGRSHNADDPLFLSIFCTRSILWSVTVCRIDLILMRNVEEHCK
ncbi:uncharacterized protein BJ212DRAFT_1415636 [Suillus subaureus]|uniref:Uncharacterized protein n=1 Tax=Suillus subaureus TaxID=48587 RepID=A0A9P7DHV5_9AGAM|nr:uncharacterized protein BJ212DRAFT_1415636 [Suillus subaureus]KAG1793384.1 hypothetical protein BJ212DRAFT_1415636 [Suillus subaureus]